MHVMTDVSISIGAVMKPAGFDASEGVLSAGYLKDASDPQWKDDEGMKKFMAFIDKYYAGREHGRHQFLYGYATAQTMVQVLKQCRRQSDPGKCHEAGRQPEGFYARSLIPGIKINTGPDDFAPIEQLKMMRFKNGQWVLFGDIISAETTGK